MRNGKEIFKVAQVRASWLQHTTAIGSQKVSGSNKILLIRVSPLCAIFVYVLCRERVKAERGGDVVEEKVGKE